MFVGTGTLTRNCLDVIWRTAMAYRPNPNDPFITPPPGDDLSRGTDPGRIDDAGPISGTRVALYALAVVALVGALFYGMSTATNDTATNTPAGNVAQRPTTAPPPARDVTPQPNTGSGTTTGAAPSQPAPPKQ
jgi:hypothetical protein